MTCTCGNEYLTPVRGGVTCDACSAYYPDGPLVVTRHPALVDYLVEIGLVPAGTEAVQHASAETVRGRHVIGVLPLWLAADALSVTEIPLDIPAELRGAELSMEQLRQFARPPVTYMVARADKMLVSYVETTYGSLTKALWYV